ncbi:MAG TPA: cbb3-type cytochrome c oxidase N-terminal domain-containing protein [Gemmatimonadaceae bacterium]|nr:cbb3-type cytochrome c oxidase N-terminal domain-containing protein [Gemmatimonadaceae bacterium]
MTEPTRGSDEQQLLEHSYDGIQEYDNPMPQWWVTLFWVTIVFSIFYYVNPAGTGAGPGREAEYEADMLAFRAAHPPDGNAGDAPTLLATTRNRAEVAEGAKLYAAKCAACHAVDGGGLIGPNLTDDAWLHGATIDSIYATVNDGVLAKGMPAWGKLLKADEMQEVVAYVWTLHGTAPAKPKAPEGVVTSR